MHRVVNKILLLALTFLAVRHNIIISRYSANKFDEIRKEN